MVQSLRMSEFLDSLETVPEILRESVARWWERASGEDALRARYGELPDALREELPRVIAGSEFAAAVLIQDPEALNWLRRNAAPAAVRAANGEYAKRAASPAATAPAQKVLREWRRRQMLRIAWRDIAGAAGAAETLRELSELADACVRAAETAARTHLRSTYGDPRTAGGEPACFIVLAMGKLGGRELN